MSCIWLEGLMLATVGVGKSGIFIARLSSWDQDMSPKDRQVICLVHFTLQHKGAEYENLLSKQWARVWEAAPETDEEMEIKGK